MDRERFDGLARQIASGHTRRAALASLAGGVLLGNVTAAEAKKRRRRKRTRAEARRCYRGRRCDPGPGSNASGCDFSYTTMFVNRDVRGSNLGNSNFTGADLRSADFRGANLSGSCFVGAVLAGAQLGSSVNLRNAIFCGTVMPDGTVNDRDCGRDKPCCPTDETTLQCQEKGHVCSPFLAGNCCSGLTCAPWFLCVDVDDDLGCTPEFEPCTPIFSSCCGDNIHCEPTSIDEFACIPTN